MSSIVLVKKNLKSKTLAERIQEHSSQERRDRASASAVRDSKPLLTPQQRRDLFVDEHKKKMLLRQPKKLAKDKLLKIKQKEIKKVKQNENRSTTDQPQQRFKSTLERVKSKEDRAKAEV